jgi:quinoprotein dehydrogenase-associated probable ABC transporter substrate-binding protein
MLGDSATSGIVPTRLVASARTPWPAASPPDSAPPGAPPPLRVCADPNNLPFSNEKEEGFENRIAALIARDLGTTVRYTWWPQRRGFARNTLRAGTCDVILGIPSSYELALPTAPYYRSTYVFVTRADRHLAIASFDDPVLRRLRVGVHMMGDDYANSPAAVALERRGLGDRLVPSMIYGDYSEPDPPARLIEAVARGDVDVAVAWGPLAGWYAKRSAVPLVLAPVAPSVDVPFLPFVFDIAMGVRRGDVARRAQLDSELVRRRAEIRAILEDYGVPLLGGGAH